MRRWNWIAPLLLLALCFWVHSGHAAQAELTWSDNSGPTNAELGFRIERETAPCTAPDTFTEISTVETNMTTYIDPTVVAGVRYCYRVRAWNRQFLDGTGLIQYSDYSNKADYALPLVIPAVPGLLGVKSKL